MNRTLRSFAIALLAFAATTFVGGCYDVVKDATFREWCGETLCAWKLDTGSIRKAPTWHKNDHGVEFVEAPTAISQVVSDKSPRCLHFTTIADVEPSAQVTIGVDFNNDGTIDFEQPIAAVAFREMQTEVTAPRVYSGLRFVITKNGTGHAVLAQMRVQSDGKCTAPPLVLRDQALGAPCSLGTPGQCTSGVCCEGICAECCKEAREGFDVGLDGGVVTPPFVSCPNGASCEKRDVESTNFIFAIVPLQCHPGRMNRPPGAQCLADDDCASSECVGSTASAKDVQDPKLYRDDAGQWLYEDAGPCVQDFPNSGACETFTRVRGGRCR